MKRGTAHQARGVGRTTAARELTVPDGELRSVPGRDSLNKALRQLLIPGFADYALVDVVHGEGLATRTLLTATSANVCGANAPLAVAMGTLSRVLRSGEPELQEHASDDLVLAIEADVRHVDPTVHSEARSAICVPIQRDVVMGVITLVRDGRRAYTPADVRFASSFAAALAAALAEPAIEDTPASGERFLRDVASAQDNFLALVSHELRTPLQAILGWAGVLRRGSMHPSDVQRGLEAIERNAEAEARLVDALLDLARFRSGPVELRRDAVCVATLINAALEEAQPAADVRNIELRASVCSDAGYVHGDADRLGQVLESLLSNALKFTPPGGRVCVSARRIRQSLDIVVEDNGIGIHEDFLPHIFGCFTQPDEGTTRSSTGLGLGLALCRHLVELHGGRVEATSPGQDRGAKFLVRLPSRRSASARDSGRVLRPEWGGGLGGVRVLLVRRSGEGCDATIAMLESAGATVTRAGSVAKARDALWARLPDVVVSDLQKAQDGYELVRYLRSLPADHPLRGIPAIALGSSNQEPSASGDVGIFQLRLEEPVSAVDLVRAVLQLVRRRHRSASR